MNEEKLERLQAAADKLLEAARGLQREKILKKIEAELEPKMQKVFRKQGNLVVKGMEKYRGLFSEACVFSEALRKDELNKILANAGAETSEDMRISIEASTTKAYSAGVQSAADLGVVISFNVQHPEAVAWLKKHAAEMVTKIDDTTRETIGDLVTKGMEEGWSYNKTAREITSRFEEFAIGKPQLHIDSRAHLVAVTESATAYGEGARSSMQMLVDQGLEVEKSWVTVGDDLVTEECQANQDAGWIPIDDDFPSGDETIPRFPGCRCDVQYRVAPGPSAQDQAVAAFGALERRAEA